LARNKPDLENLQGQQFGRPCNPYDDPATGGPSMTDARYDGMFGYDGMYGTDDTFGGRISLARDALAFSLEDAARLLDVDAQTLCHWENDRCAPPASQLTVLAGVLQVSLSWLMTGRGHGPDWDDLTEVPPLAPGRAIRPLPALRY
jgi:HTH-type transcriptional regulator, cell division transcriptional repressor